MINTVLSSVKMVHVRLSAKLFYLSCIIFFGLFLFLFLVTFSPWLVFLYSYCWSITASRGFCSKRISGDVYVIMAHSAVPIEIWSTWKVQRALKESCKTIAHLLKFHKNLRVGGEFLTLRVAQFVLKIVNLAISMEPRGPRACVLQPHYGSWWLLIR